MIFNFTLFKESKVEEKEFSGYCFGVYADEKPKDLDSVKSMLDSVEGLEVIYNNYDNDEIFLTVVITDVNNKYLESFVRSTLYKLDKLAVTFHRYSKSDIKFLRDRK